MSDKKRVIAIGADHAGYEYKELLKRELARIGAGELLDFGTHSTQSVDYPDYVHPLAQAIENGRADVGILLCGSANGVAITANKHAGIRAAVCWQNELASLARRHNNANVICLPARFVSVYNVFDMVRIFLETDFEGGRHTRRVEKIACG